MKREEILFNHRNKVFTVVHPQNTFIIDYSNGYPVKVTTNVTLRNNMVGGQLVYEDGELKLHIGDGTVKTLAFKSE